MIRKKKKIEEKSDQSEIRTHNFCIKDQLTYHEHHIEISQKVTF